MKREKTPPSKAKRKPVTKQIRLDGIDIELVRKQIRHMYIRVREGGVVRVTFPFHVSEKEVECFILNKINWIREKQRIVTERRLEFLTSAQLRDGGEIMLLGRPRRLCFSQADQPSIECSKRDDALNIALPNTLFPIEAHQDQVEKLLQSYCVRLLEQTLKSIFDQLRTRTGLAYSSLKIKPMRSRWGSCNPCLRSINISLYLVQYPIKLVEYVALHELTHLIEPSHNERFYSLLAAHMPDWRDRRRALRRGP
ncbi:MAG: M48 family metallopeptidase [Fastidiosipilaceae bacterium]